MREIIYNFYSKYLKRYRIEWELQNSEIDQLRAKLENLNTEVEKLKKINKSIIKNENNLKIILHDEIYNLSKIRQEFKHKNKILYGRLGGVIKNKNRILKENQELKNKIRSFAYLINQLTNNYKREGIKDNDNYSNTSNAINNIKLFKR